jgi:hypothetical protein
VLKALGAVIWKWAACPGIEIGILAAAPEQGFGLDDLDLLVGIHVARMNEVFQPVKVP